MKSIKPRSRWVLAFVLSTALAGSTAKAVLIVNGSFESPVVTGFPQTTPTGWTGSPLLVHGTLLGRDPQDANQYVDIGNLNIQLAISQTFTIATPGSYLLSWYDNAFSGYGFGETVSITGVITTSFTFVGTSTSDWYARSLSVALAAGNYDVKFAPFGSLNDALIDNVRLEAAPADVPDAGSTFVLSSMAFGGLTLFARKRRSSPASELIPFS